MTRPEPRARCHSYYTLRALWDRSRQGYLTVETYRTIGGIAVSLARDAEVFLDQLRPDEQGKAMTVLLRLVGVAPDGTCTRRVATLDELMFGESPDEIRRIVDGLVSARLVVVNSDLKQQVTFVLAHDAIIHSWPRFRRQIEAESDWLRLRLRLTDAAERWQESKLQSAFLYSGGEMSLLQDSLGRHMDVLSPLEIAFVRASERALRMKQRRRFLAVTLLAASAAGMTLVAMFAWLQSKNAMEQRILAEKEAERAALANLSAASAISPDGTRMLQIDPGGDLRIIDLTTGRDISVTRTTVGEISAAIFSPDARFIATGTASGMVSIDDSMLKPVTTLRGHEAAVTRRAFSPDGRHLASGSDDGTARIWPVEEGALLLMIRSDSPVVGVAFSPDGRRLIVSSQNGRIHISDTQTGQRLR